MYKFSLNELLKNHTSMKVGGPADIYIEVDSIMCLCDVLKTAKKYNLPFFLIGNGTNLIVSDAGFRGVVVKLSGEFKKINVNGNILTCGAGLKLIDACKFALNNSLSGLEFAYGIPGSCGGAIYMNAGAYGGEMKDIVRCVHCVDNNYNEVCLSPEDCNFSYRKSVFSENNMIISSVELSLDIGSFEEIENKMDNIMKRRIDKQPLDFPNAGSIFKRPSGYYVGPLIEQCGLKGFSIGDASVSTKHTGFIVNNGNASCDDVMLLINKIQSDVYNKFKIHLDVEPIYLSSKEQNYLGANFLNHDNFNYCPINQEFRRNI